MADLALTDVPDHLHINSIKDAKYHCHSATQPYAALTAQDRIQRLGPEVVCPARAARRSHRGSYRSDRGSLGLVRVCSREVWHKFFFDGIARARRGTETVCPLATARPRAWDRPRLDRGSRDPSGPAHYSTGRHPSSARSRPRIAPGACLLSSGRSRARSTTDGLCGQAPGLLPSFGSFCQFSSLVFTLISTDTN
jgi:hypothetical protein